jgi:peptide/nickel transport system substrate-binding protein
MITPFLLLYALHDAMVKPMPGNAAEPCLAEAWKMAPDGLSYQFTRARRGEVPQRRAGDGGGREVLLRALSGTSAALMKERVASSRRRTSAACVSC